MFDAAPEGGVFAGIRDGELATITYRRAWDNARRAALSPAEYASPLACDASTTFATPASPHDSTEASHPPKSPNVPATASRSY
ncbi:hypothetical protein Airi02_013120 [Actinoallomurus iriomotensis]|uniref:Uncharacterized protein n=1 Tax=Actinoallomurus iriomotensis TaxID=478107 RepID=A0A9W6S089_9ACTN|nr:hypothetical protein Airi02_013120 [Actinoallomurus iriomotensis]